MQTRKPTTPICFLALGLVVSSLFAHADSNVDRLVDLLLGSKSHRVRTEAAYSLGNLNSTDSRDALLHALMDPHEAVRTAALSSLAKIGDRSAVTVLRDLKDKNHVVRDQLHRTLIYLEERFPDMRRPVNWRKIRSVIEIGSIADRSRIGRKGLSNDLKKYLARHFRMHREIAVEKGNGSLDRLSGIIKRHRIKPLIVTGNLVSLSKRSAGKEVIWEAALSVTVLDYPERSIRAMINNSAEVHRPERIYKKNQDYSMQDRAIEEAIRAATDNLATQIKKI
ncbi:MAG: HEAT repeat domain-containing protein [Deltaproteobacteria bacterium]|nr:HEAT repeat domain-containing protein [Deltaproteobacteria bacterium]